MAGFTLLELTVSLAILGLMASAAAAAYLGMFRGSASKLSTDAGLTSLSESVIAFARARHRLPCPDAAGAGYEGLAAGVCPAGTAVGWFPYLSAGLSLPAPDARAIYGVYRSATIDLATATEHTGDAAGAPSYADGADLLQALGLAANLPVAGSQIYLTGDGIGGSAENCATNVVSNPAFVILAPGEDRDGDGKRVDGIHSSLPASGLCFAAPTRALDTRFDDRTAAVGFYAMIAKLNP